MNTTSSPAQRILVVDDDADILAFCASVLEASGYEVLTAASGEQAIECAADDRLGLVIVDIRMPGIDGFETVRRLRAMHALADAPVVFLTAHSDLESRARALDVGAADFIAKPVDQTELLIRVRSLLWVRRLQGEIGGLYDLVRNQRDGLLEARQQRTALVSFVVHDLNNPLATMALLATSLASDPALDATLRSSVEAIVDASESMRLMVQNLQAISASAEAPLRLRRTTFAVGPLAREVLAAMAPRARASGHALVLAEGGSAEVEADLGLVRRVLENLVDNAMKYAPEGGEVSVRVTESQEGVILSVEDRGPGVPEAERARIFERNYRMAKDRQEGSREGSGLGLAFCKLVADAHGGRVWVDGGDPNGAVFSILLPR